MEKITVIVPCYNEQEALHYYYEEMSRVMNEMKEVDFELLFINDGSKDKTLDIIKEEAQKNDRLSYISFSRNFGKESMRGLTRMGLYWFQAKEKGKRRFSD